MKTDPGIQFKTRKEIKNFQEESLLETLNYVSNNSPYYKRVFKERGIDVQMVKKLE
ncbi:MAG: phenylacetate--CoA ligase family protein, partial [Bacteroidales bacterium]|nr:phenylacetate--CoA ligase family protein [Bacteroidales bacterium]